MTSLAIAVACFFAGALLASRGTLPSWLGAVCLFLISAGMWVGIGTLCGSGPLSACWIVQ